MPDTELSCAAQGCLPPEVLCLLEECCEGGGGGDPDQNLWLNIAVAGETTLTANTTTDTLNVTGAGGIVVTTNPAGDEIIFTGTGIADTHLLGNDLTQAGALRQHAFGGNTQDWNNLGTFDIQINNQYVNVVGTGANTSTIEQLPTSTSTRFTTAAGTNEVETDDNGINLNFESNSDLKLDTAPGLLDQYLASQGPDTPPVWKTLPAVAACTVTNGTEAAIMALKAGGSLVSGCYYEINDHVQGYMTGSVIRLRATDSGRFAMACDIVPNPAWGDADNAWSGLYNCTTNLLIKVEDNLGNTVTDEDGTAIAEYPWGASTWTNNRVHGSTLVVEAAPTSTVRRNLIWSGYVDLTGATGTWQSNEILSGTLFAENATTHANGFSSNQLMASTIDLRNNSDSPLIRHNVVACSSDVVLSGARGITFERNVISGDAQLTIATSGIGNSSITNNTLNNATITTDYGFIVLSNSHVCDGAITSLQPAGPEVPETDAGLNISSSVVTGNGLIENSHLDVTTITGCNVEQLSQLRTKNAAPTTTPNIGPIAIQYELLTNDSEAIREGGLTARYNSQFNNSKVVAAGNTYDLNFVGIGYDLSTGFDSDELFLMRNVTHINSQIELDICENQHHQAQLTP